MKSLLSPVIELSDPTVTHTDNQRRQSRGSEIRRRSADNLCEQTIKGDLELGRGSTASGRVTQFFDH